MFTLITIILVATLFIIFSILTVLYAYKNNYIATNFILLARTGLNFIMPFIITLSGLFQYNIDNIRDFYIDINNILALSSIKKVSPEKVLLLIPHCLQNSDCTYKLTNNIGNCKRCGKCCVGDILTAAQNEGVIISVATGGTAAINIVKKYKPELIIAIACERDLVNGINDVRGIPVVGILNERPNGPCYNTVVDVNTIEKEIKTILMKKEDMQEAR